MAANRIYIFISLYSSKQDSGHLPHMIIRQFRIPVVLLIVTDWKCPIFSSYWWPTFLHGFFDPFLDWYSGVAVLDSWGKNPVISKELSDKILALKSTWTSCSKRKSGWGPVVVIWVSCCCTTFMQFTFVSKVFFWGVYFGVFANNCQ